MMLGGGWSIRRGTCSGRVGASRRGDRIGARRRAGFHALVFAVLSQVTIAAEPVQISKGDCNSGVRVVARQVPLPELLKELAHTLDFQLKYDGDPGRVVSVNATRPAAELISSLSPQDSVIVTQAPDARCPGRNRVVKVWVLASSKGGASAAPAATSPARPPASAARPPQGTPVVREQVIPASPQLEEQSRRAKQAYDDYVRAHGVPPPGAEEDAAKVK